MEAVGRAESWPASLTGFKKRGGTYDSDAMAQGLVAPGGTGQTEAISKLSMQAG